MLHRENATHYVTLPIDANDIGLGAKLTKLLVAVLLFLPSVAAQAGEVEPSEVFPSNFAQPFTGVCFYEGALYGAAKGNVLIKYDPATGEQLEIVDPIVPGLEASHMHGMTVGADGTFWVGDIVSRRLFQLQFSDYAVVAILDAPIDAPTYGLNYRDGLLWIGYHSFGSETPVHAVEPQTGEIVDVLEFGGTDVHGLVWRAGQLWALDNLANVIYRVYEQGTVEDTFDLPADFWASLAHDGNQFWINSYTTFFHIDLPEPLPCPADLDGSGAVGAGDLAELLGDWGPCTEPCEPGNPITTCAADLDGNCGVGPFDLAQLLGAWGMCP